MLEVLTHIALGVAISFIGTLPLGIINLTIVDQTIRNGPATGLKIAAGSIAVEFFQTLIAFQFAALLLRIPALSYWFHWVALPVFAGLFLYYFLKRDQPHGTESRNNNINPFVLGMLISAANLMIFPYWIGWGGMLSSRGWLKLEFFYIFMFAIGTLAGTFLALFLFIQLSRWISVRFKEAARWSHYIIAFVFLVLTLGEVWTIWSLNYGE